jgi:hypothetical protein
LAVVAAVALSGAASAQSVSIERHDNMGSQRMMRGERVETTTRTHVREPRVTGTIVHGKSAMAPGQRKKMLHVQTGRKAMEMDHMKPAHGGASVTIRH